MDEEVKEWISVKSGPQGTFVTVSLVWRNLASKKTLKTYGGALGPSVTEARKIATSNLDEIKAVLPCCAPRRRKRPTACGNT